MIYQTKGIILHRFMHSDSKMIVKIYTESFGTLSYLCFRSSNKKKDNYFFNPMSLVEITAEKKAKSNFDYIKEINVLEGVNICSFDIAKSSVSLFLNEVLYQLLFDASEDKSLFDFLFINLSRFFTEPLHPDFHLRFLLALTRELGFFPEDNYSEKSMCFNIEESCFEANRLVEQEEQTLGTYFHYIQNQDLFFSNYQNAIPYKWRNLLLDMMLKYYTLHITNLSQIKSHEILKTVLHQ